MVQTTFINSQVIVLQSNGNSRILNIKCMDNDDLYKRAGFKSNDGFKCVEVVKKPSYTNPSQMIEFCLYGKDTGRATQNKCDMGMFTTKVYGGALVVAYYNTTREIYKCSLDEWKQYTKQYGGNVNSSYQEFDDEHTGNDNTALQTTASSNIYPYNSSCTSVHDSKFSIISSASNISHKTLSSATLMHELYE